MITISSKGSFRHTDNFLRTVLHMDIRSKLEGYGRMGVQALASATPVRSGLTANSWDFEVLESGGSWSLIFSNSNMAGGTPLVILIQYGHGTGTGGFVQGQDFINPAIQPIFDKISDGIWEAVKSA